MYVPPRCLISNGSPFQRVSHKAPANSLFRPVGQPPIHVTNGSVVRLIDFAPDCESPMHRAMSIDYGVVVEGKFQLTLDSGETRIMLPGDMSRFSCLNPC